MQIAKVTRDQDVIIKFYQSDSAANQLISKSSIKEIVKQISNKFLDFELS